MRHLRNADDIPAQKRGIDRWVQLDNGQILRIEEKERGKWYGDILLEYVSNDATNAPGWMEKDLNIHYLLYSVPSRRFCYVYPWHMLKRAWDRNKEDWRERFGTVTACNVGYNTLSVPVPLAVLTAEVYRAGLILLPK